MKIAEALQTAASQLVIGPLKEAFDVSISCGICALVPMPEELARAIAAAEMACKSAKNRGGRQVKLYAFEDGSMMRRHTDALAVGQLRSALKADRLLLYAQRIAPLLNPSLPGGYELLLRLRDVTALSSRRAADRCRSALSAFAFNRPLGDAAGAANPGTVSGNVAKSGVGNVHQCIRPIDL